MKFANATVFALFFGIALIEAPQKENWLEAPLDSKGFCQIKR